MKVLLSIKPEFAEKILSGEKRYEYRKVVFKREVSTVVIYATCPVGEIVGEFEIETILNDDPKSIWEKTKKFSGITQNYFKKYFSGRKNGYAIKIGKVKRYEKAIPPKHLFENFVAPQSFRYLESF